MNANAADYHGQLHKNLCVRCASVVKFIIRTYSVLLLILRHKPFIELIARSERIEFHPLVPFIVSRFAHAAEQEGIRLFVVKNLLEPMVHFDTLVPIELDARGVD